jgi:hypothetical protein
MFLTLLTLVSYIKSCPDTIEHSIAITTLKIMISFHPISKKFLVTDGQSDKHIVISHSSDDLLVFIADLNGNWALPNNDIPYANYVLIRSDEKWEEAKYLIAKFSNIPYDVGKILEDLLSV